MNSTFSPDGRWISYTFRTATSEAAIFVQLFYFGQNGTTSMSTPVSLAPAFTFANAEPLPGQLPTTTTGRSPLDYDITPDGLAFVWAKPVGFEETTLQQQNELRVILNWHEELKRLVPTHD